MRSVRFARLLASTALVVLLAGAAGALAQTAETPPDKAPAVSDTAPAMGSDPVQGHAMPEESPARRTPPAKGPPPRLRHQIREIRQARPRFRLSLSRRQAPHRRRRPVPSNRRVS